MDFAASIVRIAGAKPPEDRSFDGMDVIKLLEERRPPRSRTLFWRGRRGERTRWAVRDGDLKYVREQDSATTREFLFDLANDVAERRDLSAVRTQDVARLTTMLAAWERRVQSRR
jgi:arylsulfatase A-like enzyme